ncbi:DNA primase [bacterium]|nr:DNA primase [bacterium]
MLAQKTREQVKSYTDIVNIISEYVTLKKKGTNYVGLCPFHSEKTPSFVVSPEKMIWHCFGCHSSGDLIAFIMKIDNLTFTEAVKELARKIGVEIVEEQKSEFQHYRNNRDEKDKESILEVLCLAREFWINELQKNQNAREYLLARGLSLETMKTFHVGYADARSSLLPYLLSKGFSKEFLNKSGLLYKTESEEYILRFRGRVIFPVLDHFGRTLGFGGRILTPRENTAKYLNSPETILFNKRKLFYALDQAQKHIKQNGFVLVMEGYMDVLMAHMYGFKNSVATMGTALTNEHARLIKRFTTKVFLAMDSDAAGQEAVERSYKVLRSMNLEVKVICFPEKDPADVLLNKGKDFFQQLVDSPINMIDFVLDNCLKKYDIDKIENVSKVIEKLIPFLRSETDPIIQNYFIKNLSTKLKVEKELIVAKIRKSSYNISNRLNYAKISRKNKYQQAEEFLIYAIVHDLDKRAEVKKVLNVELISEEHRDLVLLILDSELIGTELLNNVTLEKLQNILNGILIGQDLKNKIVKTVDWQQCLDLFGGYDKKQRIKEIKEELKILEERGDEAGGIKLLSELHNLVIK